MHIVHTRLNRGDLDVDVPGVPLHRPDEVAGCDPSLPFILSKDNSVFDNLKEEKRKLKKQKDEPAREKASCTV